MISSSIEDQKTEIINHNLSKLKEITVVYLMGVKVQNNIAIVILQVDKTGKIIKVGSPSSEELRTQTSYSWVRIKVDYLSDPNNISYNLGSNDDDDELKLNKDELDILKESIKRFEQQQRQSTTHKHSDA